LNTVSWRQPSSSSRLTQSLVVTALRTRGMVNEVEVERERERRMKRVKRVRSCMVAGGGGLDWVGGEEGWGDGGACAVGGSGGDAH